LKTSPSWGEVLFLHRKNLEAQGFRLMQKAYLKHKQRVERLIEAWRKGIEREQIDEVLSNI